VVYEFPQWLTLLDISCVSPDEVWAIGLNEQTNSNQIYYSSDGGESWTLQYSGMDLSIFLLGIDMLNPSQGFISGSYMIFMPDAEGCGAMTTNGGAVWDPVEPPFLSLVANYLTVTAVSEQEAHMVGSWSFDNLTGLYSTYDGGSSWETHTAPASHALRYLSVQGNEFWATGGTWPEEEGLSGQEPSLSRFHEYVPGQPRSEGGRPGQYEASIWYSPDGGSNWTEQFSSTGIGYMNGIVMVDSDFGLAVGAGDFTSQIYRSTNGGDTWTRIHFPSEDEHILVELRMVSETEGWAVGYNPNGPEGQPGSSILGTSDGGLTWALEAINEPCGLLGLDMYDEHRGFACGGNNLKISRVIRYDDGYYGGDTASPAELPVCRLSSHPNPFNPKTTLLFELENAGHVRLELLDLSGRSLRLLTDASLSAGEHRVEWDGRDDAGHAVSSGVYFARLQHEGGREFRKLLLMK
jgi:photosystem II stability/assembly factor-like uncharacterized protein